MFLIDTNIISEVRKGAPCDARVAGWYAGIEDAGLYLSVLVTGEIRKGIESARPRDPRKAEVLERWLQEVERAFAERILPIDTRVADLWGRMNALVAVRLRRSSSGDQPVNRSEHSRTATSPQASDGRENVLHSPAHLRVGVGFGVIVDSGLEGAGTTPSIRRSRIRRIVVWDAAGDKAKSRVEESELRLTYIVNALIWFHDSWLQGQEDGAIRQRPVR